MLDDQPFFTLASVGIALVGLDGHCIRSNPKLADIIGQPLENIFPLIHKDDAARFETWWNCCLVQESIDVQMVTRHQETFWIHVIGTMLPDSRVMLLVEDVTARMQAEAEARYKAVIDERQRIARELHDEISQTLFTASIIAQTLPRLSETTPDQIPAQLDRLRVLTDNALREVRALLVELRPPNLHEGLLHLVGQVQRFHQIQVSVIAETVEALPSNVNAVLYRVAQEALNNAVKHAGATKIELSYRKPSPHIIELCVEDDGRGFDPHVTRRGMGLTMMRERADEIGAVLEFKQGVSRGTRLCITWERPAV